MAAAGHSHSEQIKILRINLLQFSFSLKEILNMVNNANFIRERPERFWKPFRSSGIQYY
jgi:hypothetical protein